MKCTAYTVLLAAVTAVAAVAQDFSGSGQIYVINSTNFDTATPDQAIGCLDATGAFSASNCATFTKLPNYPQTLISAAGNCSFTDPTQPANTDNKYGSRSYAFHCRPSYSSTISDSLYTVNGFKYTFLCHGDINCFYDVKTMPSRNLTTSVWEYLWGSQQESIAVGHTQVLWYWKKID
ncbi:hypothetical protein F4677DRAFT_350829 [Hypoxylon crocopeplum]|nr:hypothetical protein F4677DRAFT_350829 [Hypoxylon crocopeplum]